ncbi:MAG: hypothetical protein ABII12_03535 [Planctomycetota bacterium]|nr:hypothetical protein [bacterium]
MITNLQVCMAWHAYKSGLLRTYRDFRVYFALHEIDERRQAENRKRRCRKQVQREFVFDRKKLTDEVHSLVGGAGGRHIRSSLRRLERAGLIQMTESTIDFDETPERMPAEAIAGVIEMFNRIDSRKRVRTRSLPLPRRMIRHIAGDCPAARAATVLGYAMRCLFPARKGISAEGSCSVSFVSELFGVHPRTVKRSRAELVVTNWLIPGPADRWHVQRFGGRATVNLAWENRSGNGGNVAGAACSTALSPRPPRIDTKMPPPVSNRNLPSGRNHKPASGRPDGAWQRFPPGLDRWLGHVALEDLRDDGRLAALFERACMARLLKDCENDRLRFFAAAEHALSVGTTNAPGLFATIVRRGLWHVITLSDEERTVSRMKRMRDGSGVVSENVTPNHAGRVPTTFPPSSRRLSVPIESLVRRVANQRSIELVLKNWKTPDALPGLVYRFSARDG